MEAPLRNRACASSPPPHTSASTASSSDSSSTATAPSRSSEPLPTPVVSNPDLATTTAQSTPSNDAIEAAIRAAITSSNSSPRSVASVPSMGKASGTSDGRTVPPRDTRTQLFVGNLPYRVRWQDLKDLFRRAGTVLRADVSLGPDNRSRGYGTVLLATAEDAGRAIDMFNGYEWQSRILEVRVDRIGGPMPLPGEPGTQATGLQPPMMGGVQMMSPMYMGQPAQASQGILSPAPSFGTQLPTQTSTIPIQSQQTTSQSHQIFSPQPHTVSLSQLHARLQAPANDPSQFEQLQQQYRNQPLHLQQQPPSIPGRTLFVGNLPYHVQWQDLKDLFRGTPGGVTVLRADVALGPDGRSKGFGTVTLRTEEETEKAKRWFSGYEFHGRQLKVHHDRVPLSASGQSGSLASSTMLSASPSMISQQMAMLNLGSVLRSQRSTSPSPTTSSSSSTRASQAVKLRSETSSSPSSVAARSPLLRHIQVNQHSQSFHQPSPLYSAVSVDLPTSLPSSRQGSGELSNRETSITTSSLPISSPTSTSPSVSRANRPTHIALPPPSFGCDFDPSLASLDSLDNPAYVEGQNRGEAVTEQQLQQQTTPLQIHFRQYFQRERSARHQSTGEREKEAPRDFPPGEARQQLQLYQLLHGSRQLAASGSNSPKPQLPKLSTSSTASSVASAASSTASLFDTPDRLHQPGHYGPAILRESSSSGASSAAASTKSLPLGLGGGMGIPVGKSSSQPSSKAATRSRDTSPGRRRPLSTVSTTGSTTSASDNSLSTSFSGTSRTGSSGAAGGDGHDLKGDPSATEASEGWLNMYPEKERQERSPHPRHPGPITLPPLAEAFSTLGAGAHHVSEGQGVSQQYYPFMQVGAGQVGDRSEFGVSGQSPRQAHAEAKQRSAQGSSAQSEAQHPSSKKDVPGYFQPPAPHGYPMHPMPQLTPHGLPPLTPSMPPFTFMGSQQATFLSPGMYPTSPIGPGGTSHFQLRQQRMQQSVRPRPHPNAPGTLSLPPQQLVFVPHRQSPIISPASTIGPGTAPLTQGPSYLQPLGSPGSPYALGPHHPLHHAHHQQHPFQPNPYAHPPHPLSNSFGVAAGGSAGVPAMSPGAVGLAAMSPGAPWGKPGQMVKPYVNAAVGAPVRRGNKERGRSHSRTRSKEQEDASSQSSEMQQPQYYHPSGYWGYTHHHTGGAEPKGYFDQLYTSPGGYRYPEGSEEGGSGKGGRERGESQSAVEREILKDKMAGEEQPLNSDSTKLSDPTSSLSLSTSPGTPDTAATEPEEGGEFEGKDHEGVGELVPPPLQHAKTDPAGLESHARITRTLTGGDN